MLKASWQFLFGDGRWRLRDVSVTLVFVMLAATAIYAWQESSAPSATPILFFMIFCSAFAILSVVFSRKRLAMVRSNGLLRYAEIVHDRRGVIVCGIVVGISVSSDRSQLS
jgi:hypothetical protein